MLALLVVPTLVLGLLGCESSTDPTFGGGGVGNAGDDGGEGDGGSSLDPAAPTITELTAVFYTPPNFDLVIEVYAHWEDAEEDMWDGKVVYDILASDGEELSGTLDITGEEARLDDDVDGDPVFFWVQGVSSSLTYDVEVTLKDAEGHASQAATTTCQ